MAQRWCKTHRMSRLAAKYKGLIERATNNFLFQSIISQKSVENVEPPDITVPTTMPMKIVHKTPMRAAERPRRFAGISAEDRFFFPMSGVLLDKSEGAPFEIQISWMFLIAFTSSSTRTYIKRRAQCQTPRERYRAALRRAFSSLGIYTLVEGEGDGC